MRTFREFMASRSGYLKPREGMSVGWLVVALMGLAMVLGTVDNAQAAWTECCQYAVPGGPSVWCCSSDWCSPTPPTTHYSHNVQKDGGGQCHYLQSVCNCL